MTWELAESGKHFITTIINGSDLVPTFSTASIDDLRFRGMIAFIPSDKLFADSASPITVHMSSFLILDP